MFRALMLSVIKPIFNTLSYSRLSEDDVLCAITPHWTPIHGSGNSVETLVTTLLCLSERISVIELETKLEVLRQRQLVEIQYRPQVSLDGHPNGLVRMCRRTYTQPLN